MTNDVQRGRDGLGIYFLVKGYILLDPKVYYDRKYSPFALSKVVKSFLMRIDSIFAVLLVLNLL